MAHQKELDERLDVNQESFKAKIQTSLEWSENIHEDALLRTNLGYYHSRKK